MSQMLSEKDTPGRNSTGNSDLDEVAILFAQAMEGSVPVEKACHADVVLRIKKLLSKK